MATRREEAQRAQHSHAVHHFIAYLYRWTSSCCGSASTGSLQSTLVSDPSFPPVSSLLALSLLFPFDERMSGDAVDVRWVPRHPTHRSRVEGAGRGTTPLPCCPPLPPNPAHSSSTSTCSSSSAPSTVVAPPLSLRRGHCRNRTKHEPHLLQLPIPTLFTSTQPHRPHPNIHSFIHPYTSTPRLP